MHSKHGGGASATAKGSCSAIRRQFGRQCSARECGVPPGEAVSQSKGCSARRLFDKQAGGRASWGISPVHAVRRPTRAAKPRGHVYTRLEQRAEAPVRPTALLVSLGGPMLFRAPSACLTPAPPPAAQTPAPLRGTPQRSAAWQRLNQSKGAGKQSEAVEVEQISCSAEKRGHASAATSPQTRQLGVPPAKHRQQTHRRQRPRRWPARGQSAVHEQPAA